MAGAAYGIATTALRFFNVYGTRQDPKSQYSGVISIFIDRVLATRRRGGKPKRRPAVPPRASMSRTASGPPARRSTKSLAVLSLWVSARNSRSPRVVR